MTKMMLALAVISVVALPSCMHPVDQALNARAASRTAHLEESGRVSQGACDDVGQYAAKNVRGLTMRETAVADISE
jgi:hypothetical protein